MYFLITKKSQNPLVEKFYKQQHIANKSLRASGISIFDWLNSAEDTEEVRKIFGDFIKNDSK